MEKQYNIEFEYADNLSNWEWRKQSCTLYAADKAQAIKKCEELYGLGIDCDHRIIHITEIGLEGSNM